MDVYLYMGGFTHTLNKELYLNSPDGVNFIPSTKDLFDGDVKKDILQSRKGVSRYTSILKRCFLDIAEVVGVPKIRYLGNTPGDLIHSNQYLILDRKPWVLDFEDLSALVWYRHRMLGKGYCRRIIEKILSSKNCRKIIPWTNAAKMSLMNGLDASGFEDKVEVVYPYISPKPGDAEKTSSDSTRLLFVGTAFYPKGGLDLLRAFEVLDRRFDVELTVVSNVPEDVLREYEKYDNITFLSRIPKDVLESSFRDSDIFVLPFHTDTFGFVLLEAFSYGLPCVVTDQFASKEIVTDGVTGTLIPNYASRFDDKYQAQYDPILNPLNKHSHPLINQLLNPPQDHVESLAEAVGELISDSKLRKRYASNALKEVLSGRFSVEYGQKRLGNVYADAVA